MNYKLIDEEVNKTQIIFTKKQVFITFLFIFIISIFGSALGEWLFFITFINIP